MKVIYIAGPFRADTTWEIECNVRRAEELGLCVASLGAMPLIPHANTRFFHGLIDDRFWLDGTQELLKRCDAVIMMKDWQCSTGSKGEKELAENLNIPIFYESETVSALYDWLKKENEKRNY
ncbi:MAG: DUF7768 domain-containing protein [Candidatus Thorarchaeota archaeon]